MNECSIITIDWDLLCSISYRTRLGKSLKNTLHKFDKDELFEEIGDMIDYFTEIATDEKIKYENRIKALHSVSLKYDKHFPNTPVEKTFNDILGIRVIVNDYSIVDIIEFPETTRVADMRKGKSQDDGYRGIHVYYQKDHFHYPIEIQFVTSFDRQFNAWLHTYLYKYVDDLSVGSILREKYENGQIISEEQFRKEMNKYVLSGS